MSAHILTPDSSPKAISSAFATGAPSVFLAGSIENGAADDWQVKAIKALSAAFDDIVIVNPRRVNWNPNLVQSIHEPEFKHQVTFELDHIEKVDTVLVWIDPSTKSPITLLELGLLSGSVYMGDINRTVVGCPQGFYRRGNVEVVCDRYRIPLVETFGDLIQRTSEILQRNYQRRVEFRSKA